MRKRSVFVALGTAAALFFGTATSFSAPGPQSSPTPQASSAPVAPPAPLTERQMIDQDILTLNQLLSVNSSMEERFRVLAKTEAIIRSTREHAPRQSEDDEIFFDTYLAILAELPRDQHFKKSSCGEYVNRIRNDFEPTAEPDPQNPAVEAGMKTLSALCN